MKFAELLITNDYQEVYNVEGGLMEYARTIDPTIIKQ